MIRSSGKASRWIRSHAAAVSAAACVAFQLMSAPGLSAQARWRVASRPDLMIGVVDGDRAYMFHSIADSHFLPDGRVAVADAGFLDVRLFRPDGSIQARMGRQGDGPGEFRAIGAMWLTPKGLIAVWDPTLRRITTFHPNGDLAGTTPVFGNDGTGTNVEVYFGSFTNGDVALASLDFGPRAAESTPDLWRVSRFGLDGRFRGRLGDVRGMWRFNRNPIPFSPMPSGIVFRDSLYIADGYEAEIAVRSGGGRASRTIRLPVPALNASRAVWAALETSLQRRGKKLFLEYLRERRVPRDSRLPQIADIRFDDRGQLWVKRYDPRFDSIWLREQSTRPAPGGEWSIMRADGSRVASVQLPPNVRPLEIGGGRLLGVAVDGDDVERIVVYRLTR